MKLPLLISVPHAGLWIPPEVRGICALTPQQIAADGDEGAAEIYDLKEEATAFVTTDVARAIVDLNRDEDDRTPDGVVKTHTCWNVPVYDEFPGEEVIEALLDRYHRPYHTRLRDLARADVKLGLDCHTMAAKGPPVGPDAGLDRPWICLSNADGTCPQDWLESLASSFRRILEGPVSLNVPFKGGHIIRSHAAELPWIQMEVSRAPFMSCPDKRSLLVSVLREWVSSVT